MAEHGKLCPEEIIQCSMCTNSFKRSELSAHLNDPSSVTTHLLTLHTNFEELRCENQWLKKHMAMVTSRDREVLVEALGKLRKITPMTANEALAVAMKNVMGDQEWEKV